MYYADDCEVSCTDNGRNVQADVLEFKEGDRLTVALDRSVKLSMNWDNRASLYVGNMAGMEFTSRGPAKIA